MEPAQVTHSLYSILRFHEMLKLLARIELTSVNGKLGLCNCWEHIGLKDDCIPFVCALPSAGCLECKKVIPGCFMNSVKLSLAAAPVLVNAFHHLDELLSLFDKYLAFLRRTLNKEDLYEGIDREALRAEAVSLVLKG